MMLLTSVELLEAELSLSHNYSTLHRTEQTLNHDLNHDSIVS